MVGGGLGGTHLKRGGGAEMTSVEEATKSIKAGKVFEPIDASSCRVFFGGDLSKKYGISWSMYYRQSEMFVKFLKERDGAAFKMTLRSLKENKNKSLVKKMRPLGEACVQAFLGHKMHSFLFVYVKEHHSPLTVAD